jgi:pimeloyl-ACP methyl ester carboxylesterase
MASRAIPINSTNVRNAMMLTWERVALGVASAFAPRRAVERAARLFATPPRHAHPAREIELLQTGRGFVVALGFRRLAVWRFGSMDAPVIVFSHGWGGRGAQFRAFVPRLVQAGYQVVLFDHEGHGHSEGDEASLVHFLRGLEAVIAHLEREGATIAGLVGHSLGASAIAALLNGTGRGIRTVLVAPPTSLERYSGHFARRLGLRESIRRAMQETLEERLGRRWQEFELPGSVARAAAPVLVIHDEQDRDVPLSSGLALARAWRGARMVRTRGLGHRAVLRDPDVVQDALDFIADRTEFPRPLASGEASPFRAPAPLA